MQENSASSFGWKTVVIALLVALGIFFLGWEPGPNSHEVNVCVIQYDYFVFYHYHPVPYHEGMTIREAVNATTQKRGLPSVNESEMRPSIDRHLVWTWRGACRRSLDALTSLMRKMDWQIPASQILYWEMRHDLMGDPHVWRVDHEHSHWNSEAQPGDVIYVDKQDVFPR